MYLVHSWNKQGCGSWGAGGGFSYPPLTPTNWRLFWWVAGSAGSSFRFMMDRMPAWGPPGGRAGVTRVFHSQTPCPGLQRSVHLGGHTHLPAPPASSDSHGAACLGGSLVLVLQRFFLGCAREAAADPGGDEDDSAEA